MNEQSGAAGGESSASQTSVFGFRVQRFSQVCPMEPPKGNQDAGASALGPGVSPLLEIHSIY